MNDETNLNNLEQECLILNSVWEMIDEMVNWAMFVKFDRSDPSNLMFENSAQARLFNILLGDFLSYLRPAGKKSIPFGLPPPPSREGASPSDLTFLYYLRQVCASPHLGGDVTALTKATEAFAEWLETELTVEGVNLSEIDVVADIRVSRIQYLRICGDIAKHNLTRLSANAERIRRLIEASGHVVSEQEAYLAVAGFFDWFHRDVFIYEASFIAQFLNDIRWAIYEYLRPEFERSFHLQEPPRSAYQAYSYHIPQECREPVAHAMYWNAMNRVRARPWFHKFAILPEW